MGARQSVQSAGQQAGHGGGGGGAGPTARARLSSAIFSGDHDGVGASGGGRGLRSGGRGPGGITHRSLSVPAVDSSATSPGLLLVQ